MCLGSGSVAVCADLSREGHEEKGEAGAGRGDPANHQHLGVWLKKREGDREVGEKPAADCFCEAEEGVTHKVN